MCIVQKVQQKFAQPIEKEVKPPIGHYPPITFGKQLFDKIKKGDVEEVSGLVREYGIDLANLIDEPRNFSQTVIFSACVVKDE